MPKKISYEQFKSEVCHALKREGDIGFVNNIVRNRVAEQYFSQQYYVEALYIVAMVDYISRVNDIPLYDGYEGYRHIQLEEERFAAGTLTIDTVNHNTKARKKARENAIPEFKRHNIMEAEVRDAV